MTAQLLRAPLMVAPLVLALAACGGGGGGGAIDGGSPGTGGGPDGGTEEVPSGALPAFSDRQTFANDVINAQQAIVAAGAANPADLPASATYAGSWAMSLDPGGDLEVVGGSVALEADFAGGTLTGTMEQEILPGGDGTLSIENGRIAGADLDGDLRGSLADPNGGVIGVDTAIDGFVSNSGAQGTMTGTATRGGGTVGAQGVFGAEQVGSPGGGSG